MSEASPSDKQFRAFIDRILRLKEEQDNIGDDIKDVYAEAKANGYDKSAMGALVTELRKRGKDASKFDQLQSDLELYREAYERALSHTHAHARAGKAMEANGVAA